MYIATYYYCFQYTQLYYMSHTHQMWMRPVRRRLRMFSQPTTGHCLWLILEEQSQRNLVVQEPEPDTKNLIVDTWRWSSVLLCNIRMVYGCVYCKYTENFNFLNFDFRTLVT